MHPPFLTYLHCTPDSMPFYVGQGSWKRAYSLSAGRNPHHRRVVAEYGKDNILVFVFPCESEQEAINDEIHQIAQLRAEGIVLTNYTAGGKGGARGLVYSPERRAKVSGPRPNFFGPKYDRKWRAKLSASAKIRWAKEMLKPETRERLIAMARKRWNKGT